MLFGQPTKEIPPPPQWLAKLVQFGGEHQSYQTPGFTVFVTELIPWICLVYAIELKGNLYYGPRYLIDK